MQDKETVCFYANFLIVVKIFKTMIRSPRIEKRFNNFVKE
jgi:hypothetical protein